MTELGRTGLRHFYGRLDEEFLNELKGSQALKVYREMGDNDPTVGAAFNAINWLIRQVPWRVEGDDPQQPDERVELIESARLDMSHTWEDFIAEAVRGTLQYGWQAHECVYKVRELRTSRFPDGKIGWKRLPVRAQDTLDRWDFDEFGDVRAMIQRPAPDFKERALPMEKLLLFRTDSVKNSPEGRSILRNAYRPWYFKKHLENIEAIGLERRLAGLPIVWGPARLFDGTASGADQQTRDYLEKVATGIRKDEQWGVGMPLAYDENGNKLFDLTLLATGGESEVDTSEAIQRYDLRILQLLLADFIQVGHGSTGSWALQDSKTELFGVAIAVFMDMIAAPFNQHAIPRLLELNGMDTQDPPQLKHGDIDQPDIQLLGGFLTALKTAGLAIFPDLEAENKVREILGLKQLTQEEWDDKQAEREAQMQAERDHEMALTQRNQPPKEQGQPKPPPAETEKAAVTKVEAHVHMPTQAPAPAPSVTVGGATVHVTTPQPGAQSFNLTLPEQKHEVTLVQPIESPAPQAAKVDVHMAGAPVHVDAPVTIQPPAPVVIPAPEVTIEAPVLVEASHPTVKVDVAAPAVTVPVSVDTDPIAGAIREQTAEQKSLWDRALLTIERVFRRPKKLDITLPDGTKAQAKPDE